MRKVILSRHNEEFEMSERKGKFYLETKTVSHVFSTLEFLQDYLTEHKFKEKK